MVVSGLVQPVYTQKNAADLVTGPPLYLKNAVDYLTMAMRLFNTSPPLVNLTM